MWFKSAFFKYATAIVLILTIFVLFRESQFLFSPFLDIVDALLIPFIISGVVYYILRPIVSFVHERMKTPMMFSIFLVFLAVLIILFLSGAYLVPKITEQISEFLESPALQLEKIKETTEELLHEYRLDTVYIQRIEEEISQFLSQAVELLRQNFVTIIETFAKVTTTIVVIPFIVYYFLKDGKRFTHDLLNSLPEEHRKLSRNIVREIDMTLANYITGQIMIAVCFGIMMFIGYTIIGLDYALVLAILAIVLNIIPILGPFIAILPALLIGISQGVWMALNVLIVFTIAQQIDGNFITPQLMRLNLRIHPLTIILLLMVAGFLYGLLALFVVIPLYAVVKVIIKNIYRNYDQIKEQIQQ